MRELFDARLNLDDTPLTPAIAEAVRDRRRAGADRHRRDRRRAAQAAGCKLKLIANFGNGVDNIDVTRAHARGITVTNTPGVLTEDTADMTMALILAVPRRLIEGASILTEGKTGRAGRRPGCSATASAASASASSAWAASARRWRAAPAPSACRSTITTAAASPEIAEELEATYWESLDQMLARMDIISVNCPHTPATYHLLSARRLKLIRKDAYIVNTARGEVIDENTLINADRSRRDRRRRPRRLRARARGQSEAGAARRKPAR
jgi:glyoxylate reductase